MTDIFSLTEQLENSAFLNSNGLPNNAGSPTQPFYYESSSNTLNFGYGINITANGSQSVSILQDSGVPAQTISLLNTYVSGTSSPNATLAASLNNSLTQVDWRSTALQAMMLFYSDIIIPAINQAIGANTFGALTHL